MLPLTVDDFPIPCSDSIFIKASDFSLPFPGGTAWVSNSHGQQLGAFLFCQMVRTIAKLISAKCPDPRCLGIQWYYCNLTYKKSTRYLCGDPLDPTITCTTNQGLEYGCVKELLSIAASSHFGTVLEGTNWLGHGSKNRAPKGATCVRCSVRPFQFRHT